MLLICTTCLLFPAAFVDLPSINGSGQLMHRIQCKVYNKTTIGEGTSKANAKKSAAKGMLKIIPNGNRSNTAQIII